MPSEDAKAVRTDNQEEEEDKKSLSSKKVTKATSGNAKPQSKITKVKKENPEADDSPRPIKAASSAFRSKQAKVRKEENDDTGDDDDQPLAKRNFKISLDKEPKKIRKIKEEGKKKGEPAAEQKKREKKVYDLPGQKRDPPEEKDPLRIFYETLYKQVPNSEMAQLWMMECGLLPKELAKKVHEMKQKKGLQQKLTSPVKAVTTLAPSVKKKTRDSKKRKVEDDSDSNDEIILANAKKRKVA